MIICSSVLMAFLLSGVSAQEPTPSMKAWEGMLDKVELANWFSDVFNTLGITVFETGEKFTVNHKGDHFTLTNGIDEANVDYSVTIKLENVSNMSKHGEDSQISSYEAYRILAVLFTPLTASSLKSPMMSKPLMRRLAGIENHIHVYLVSPDQSEITSHTLIYLNKSWIVVPGIHGDARRVFRISPEQALDYQKNMFRAMQANSAKQWKKFKKWYLKWREEVSV